MVNRPDRGWIADQLSTLMEHSEELVEIQTDVVNDYRPLTALKLIVLSAGLDMYTNISPKRYDHCYYLDLFAGAGATRIRDREEAVVGSPILAPMISDPDFREYHFVDYDKETVEALRERIQYMDDTIDEFPGERCYVHHKDANKFVNIFLDELKAELGSYEGVNLFSFIDPEGLDLQWYVTRRLCRVYGDLLINFPKLGANRSAGSRKARTFFGVNDGSHLPSGDQLREFYEEKLKGCKHTDITVPLRIDSGATGQHFHYDLIYATRRTQNDSPYVQAMEAMKTKIGVLDGDHIGQVMDTLRGDVMALDGFLPDDDDVGDDDSQYGLGDFA